VSACQRADLLGLAASDEKRSVGRLALARQPCNRIKPGAARKQRQLLQLCIEGICAKIHAHEKHPRGCFRRMG